MGYAKNWLTEDEWKRLRKAPAKKDYYRNGDRKEWRDELLLKLMYRGGLRINEVLDLEYPYNFQIEDGQGYVILDPEEETDKTEMEQQYVGEDMIKQVRRFMSKHRKSSFVFTNGRGSTITRQRAYDLINELAEIAGIEKKLGTHTLRRSRAKHQYESGWNIEKVRKFLRHDNVETTKEYLKFAKKKLAEDAEELDEKRDL